MLTHQNRLRVWPGIAVVFALTAGSVQADSVPLAEIDFNFNICSGPSGSCFGRPGIQLPATAHLGLETYDEVAGEFGEWGPIGPITEADVGVEFVADQFTTDYEFTFQKGKPLLGTAAGCEFQPRLSHAGCPLQDDVKPTYCVVAGSIWNVNW